MAAEKDDLGLSLSLSCRAEIGDCAAATPVRAVPVPANLRSLQLNLMPSSNQPSAPSSSSPYHSPFSVFHRSLWAGAFATSDRIPRDGRSLIRGIDVNRLPATLDCEEEAGVSSPNSTVSSISGKRSEREANGEDPDGERASSRGISDEEDGENCRKKLRLSKDQSAVLEESFKDHNTLNPKQKQALAKRLNLRPRQVEVWFQNRRARTKLKQTEVDCEFLKRCCENLTEENRRLQKEVQELRALKISPQFYMQMTPPTTLTMCPSCERVAVPSTSAAAQPPDSVPHRPVPRAPWPLSAAVPHRPLDALHLRS